MVSVVILNAGMSRRMQQKYPGVPKALIHSSDGQCILGFQLEVLERYEDAIDNVILVVGYKEGQFREYVDSLNLKIARKVRFVVNADYDITDNAYSIHLAIAEYKESEQSILIDGDVIFSGELFRSLLSSPTENTAMARKCELTPEDAKVVLEDGFVRAIGKGLEGAYAYASLIKLGGELLRIFRIEISRSEWWQTWYSAPLTKVLKSLPKQMTVVVAEPGLSMDVDTPEELIEAFEFMSALGTMSTGERKEL